MSIQVSQHHTVSITFDKRTVASDRGDFKVIDLVATDEKGQELTITLYPETDCNITQTLS